ncbi:hypothetical protein HJC23_009277 [Cyclotella cryptica]|uniref:C2 domain-containing protein n=1 Tax=Cyclotella cryptica TaxID=29204 RepID=A0ABD3NKQ2_9STRA
MMEPPPSEHDINILICSGNIGNAEPTFESFSAWIPHDGIITVDDAANAASSTKERDGSLPNETSKKYEFIIVGMQEAAFAEGETRQSIDDTNRIVDGCSTRSSIDGGNGRGGDMEKAKRKSMLVRKVDKVRLALRGLTHTQTHRSPIIRSTKKSTISTTQLSSALTTTQYDTNKFSSLIKRQCPSYTLLASSIRGEMRLWILCLKQLEGEVREVYVAGENTGIGSVFANKGGIIATLTLRSTRLSFLTCHLEAHEGLNHYLNRNRNLVEILGGAKPHPDYYMLDATIYSHHMFVCGDLNYRIRFGENSVNNKNNNKEGGDTGEEHPDNGSHFDQALKLVEQEKWDELNAGDELAMALKKKECLVGFETLPCNFPPTFKVAREKGYVYNEKRTPSYTDRILWKSTEGMEGTVTPFLYEPCPDFITSDHKPIRGGFRVKMNKGYQTIPTSPTINDDRQFHLLVSDIKCTDLPIMDNELMGGLADPYVLFVSSPKGLLFDKAWPSTRVIYRNLNPIWDEDIHLTLNHEACGEGANATSALSLAGNMIYMVVMDYDQTSGDDIIGSVALNLKDLCSQLKFTKSHDGKKKNHLRQSVNFKEAQGIQRTTLSRPILRNGQECGMLECTVVSAYLVPGEVKSFLKIAGKVRSAKFRNAKERILASFR